MTFTDADLLSGNVPVRQDSVRFDLYDASDNLLGVLAVDPNTPPVISNDVSRNIRRRVDGLRIPWRPRHDQSTTRFYAGEINPLTQRVRPKWLLQNGSVLSMGVFLWADDSKAVYSWGTPRDCTLVDRCLLLDQPIETNIGYAPNTVVTSAIAEQVAAVGITDVSIEASSVKLSAPVAWAAGRDTRLTVLESLAGIAGFLIPYFNNSGTLVFRSAPNLATATPSFSYGLNTNVIAGSVVQSSDILTAPNRYIVVDSAAANSALVGVFDVPATAPHSYENTGRRIAKTFNVQGLQDQASANQAAAAIYAADSSTYSWLWFNTPPDPRHDTFDVLSFSGVNYRQQSWRMPLQVGGVMGHDCRGAYS